ncbi:uncharacterized protein LOC108040781 [Drosophila rhopaloa]|uniref:Uncharacterized protein LOC108040781 n=1 Tax=Drosophila rhopaloa TaxID=1041015 RepID=A0A6P4EFT2_DRORH|nr:uncharacterized protein LOC108040781 [Drosophila rhopaloa]
MANQELLINCIKYTILIINLLIGGFFIWFGIFLCTSFRNNKPLIFDIQISTPAFLIVIGYFIVVNAALGPNGIIKEIVVLINMFKCCGMNNHTDWKQSLTSGSYLIDLDATNHMKNDIYLV